MSESFRPDKKPAKRLGWRAPLLGLAALGGVTGSTLPGTTDAAFAGEAPIRAESIQNPRKEELKNIIATVINDSSDLRDEYLTLSTDQRAALITIVYDAANRVSASLQKPHAEAIAHDMTISNEKQRFVQVALREITLLPVKDAKNEQKKLKFEFTAEQQKMAKIIFERIAQKARSKYLPNQSA